MVRRFYSSQIQIFGFEGEKKSQGQALGMERGKQFVDFISKSLDKLQTLSKGRELISEIDASGKTLTIFKCPEAVANGPVSATKLTATSPEDDGVYALVNSQIKPFRAVQLNVPFGATPDVVQNRQNLFAGTATPQTGTQAAPELVRILLRAKRKYPKPGAFLSQIVGKTQNELMDIVAGRAAMDSDTYFKICLHFYEFLSPGAGVNTQIRMEWKEEFKGSDGKFNPKKDHNDVPGFLVLGHELIHAWRMMLGKRIVDGGWEEEAMTTGVGAFAGWPITENALRAELGLPTRPYYCACPTVGSGTSNRMKEMTNQIGVRAQAKAGCQTSQTALAQPVQGWGDEPGWRKHGFEPKPVWGSPKDSQMETPDQLLRRLWG
jgi:hypothetical protein